MTASGAVVKLTAKTALKNNWLKTSVACLTVIFAFFTVSIASGFITFVLNDVAAYIFFAVAAVFLLFPLIFGLIKFFWRFIFGADDNPISVFSCFSCVREYKRILRLTVALGLRAVGIGILLFLPSIIIDIFSNADIYELLNIPIPLWTSNFGYMSVFLKTVAAVVLFFLMLKYYIAPFLLIADENMEVAEAIHMSATVSKNVMLDIIYLIFGFSGWIILSVLVIPLVFTLPYMLTSLSVHVRFAIAEYNKRVESINNTGIPTFDAGI